MKDGKDRIDDYRKDVESDEIPFQKWIVMLKDYKNNQKDPKIFIRQFMAQGYYDAYDMVRSYAERSNQEILWFKEKRVCPEYYLTSFPWLEYSCRYCNARISDKDPLTCNINGCTAILCSKNCIRNHMLMRHKNCYTNFA